MLRQPAKGSAPPLPQPKCAVPKKRGSYNCGRCGLPKKGHVCSSDAPPPRSDSRLRRALSYDDLPEEVAETVGVKGEEVEEEDEWGMLVPLPGRCLVEVLRRLPLKELIGASAVCRGWKECVRRVWRSAEELRLRVSPRSQIGFVGSLLPKCSGLTKLVLTLESDVDATLLACVAFSCPNLEAFEISTAGTAANWMTGDELGRFVADKRCLTSLKVEGCTNLGSLNLSSSSLSILWLSDLYCMSKMVINCPILKELSLDFTRQENDSTDFISMMDSLGRTCPRLRNLHVASIKLSNEAVLALTSVDLRGLRMLSLVLGSKITDSSVAAIVSCYANIEMLDLSGSSISDNGIGMICNAFPQTLSRLLLALCPNITSSGIQFATAQLPYLQLIDCGMSLCDFSSRNDDLEDITEIEENQWGQKSNSRTHPIYQKLIIKHGRLKKLSLWGCSGLDALYLNCPELNDLNLNSCTNLHPERLLLQCPNLENIHASGCQDSLIEAIEDQVFNKLNTKENQLPSKRLADGSKRVQAPKFIQQQPSDDSKQKRPRLTQCSLHLDR
ncbi:F-box/LRR-repeat protein 17 [Dioscorea cayenensis subsp. rotundata]|uniref:F-box/LRR-repeat protein 17 n=1 Tax=Dioscorea cayennensis subsp. rotundata TaxID=55577 RepID=A0AB40AJX6_DIOCR|nr:F-box/LRR-repeat protein 17 [Dioscorea cayenensis subsp. rotundata]